MNIYAQEDCNDYKSTQKLELSDSSDSTECINIDSAETFAVDVSGPQAGGACGFHWYGANDCQSELGNTEVIGDSGCKDPSVSRKNLKTETLGRN